MKIALVAVVWFTIGFLLSWAIGKLSKTEEDRDPAPENLAHEGYREADYYARYKELCEREADENGT